MRTLCGAGVQQKESYLVDELPVSILRPLFLDMLELITQSAHEPLSWGNLYNYSGA